MTSLASQHALGILMNVRILCDSHTWLAFPLSDLNSSLHTSIWSTKPSVSSVLILVSWGLLSWKSFWNLSKIFSALMETDMWLVLGSACVLYHSYRSACSKQSSYPWNKSNLTMVHISSLYYWICFVFCWRFTFIKKINLYFFLSVVLASRKIWLHRNSLEAFLSFLFYRIVWWALEIDL